MNTHRRPGFDAGMRQRFARHLTSSGCIFREVAACSTVSVFMAEDVSGRRRLVPWARALGKCLAFVNGSA